MAVVSTPIGELLITDVLASYDGPRLFVCVSQSSQTYLALWVGDDEDSERWLYVAISQIRLDAVRTGRIALRQAFLEPEDGWLWEFSYVFDGDVFRSRMVSGQNLAEEDLPSEDAYLNLARESMSEYDAVLCKESLDRKREIIDLRLHTGYQSEIDMGILGLLLTRGQSLLSLLNSNGESVRESHMAVLATPAGSFRVQLASTHPPDLLSNEPSVTQAIVLFMRLLDAGDDHGKLSQVLRDIDARSAAHYIAFLKVLRSGGTSMDVNWASPGKIIHKTKISVQMVNSAIAALTGRSRTQKEQINVLGQLVAIDIEIPRRRKFTLIGEDGVKYNGRLSAELSVMFENEGSYVKATIERWWDVNPTTGREKVNYELVSVEEM